MFLLAEPLLIELTNSTEVNSVRRVICRIESENVFPVCHYDVSESSHFFFFCFCFTLFSVCVFWYILSFVLLLLQLLFLALIFLVLFAMHVHLTAVAVELSYATIRQ